MHAIEKVLSNHTDSIRMLVLETDSPHPRTQAEKGTFGDVFHKVFHDAGEAHDPPLGIETVMEYIVEDDGGRVPDPSDIGDDVAAILITGSVYDAHGDEPWVLKLMKLMQHLWTHRPNVRFSGICFGHQILCRSLGSHVRPSPSGKWELAHTPIELTSVGRALFNLPKSESHIHLHQMHLDHVVSAPSPDKTDLLPEDANVHVWGRSEHTSVQGVYIRTRLFTSQGHLEFSEEMVRRQLQMRVEAGSLREDEVEKAREKAEWLHDGEVVAQAVLRFFHGDDDGVE